MKFPIPTDRSTLNAVEFWWEKHVSRIVKTRKLQSPFTWKRTVKLLQMEKPVVMKVMA